MSASPKQRRLLMRVSLSLLLLLGLALVFQSNRPPPSSAPIVLSGEADAPLIQAAERVDAHPRKPLRKVLAAQPPRQLRMTNGIPLELALDEAMVRQPDGSETSIALDPPATLATLPERLAATSSSPVAYPVGKERSPATRRVITRDISVNLGLANITQLLKNHRLTLKERPSYAPGWAILSAADPLAALSVLDAIRASDGVIEADVLIGRPRFKRALPNDTLISQQWHLSNTNSTRTHANVESIWNYPNLTGTRGTGIRIGIVDDGIQLTHPDFAGNIDTENDRDFIDFDNDPSPRTGFGDYHGTACAGIAAARGNNNLGVSGVAPEATIVGLRLVSDQRSATDGEEAAAMDWKNDIIDIKSNSWGPWDDGETLISERPGNLTVLALANATATGRGGKGSILVWAGGNGGSSANDNSNYDGYANSIHTIAVAASNSIGTRSSYSEPGANIVVCAPSDGTSAQLAITTTDLVGNVGYNTASGTAGNYATDFGGTSAATPVVSGTVALMLEKNPNLGWRDVQEILIRSAYKINPSDNGWSNNAAGFHFNDQFGAGLVDATAAVNLANSWNNLTSQTVLTTTADSLPVAIPDNNPTGITRTFIITENIRVEHVTLRLSASHTNHRHLEITLTSPSGMISKLGAFATGKSGESLTDWTFSSVRHWGEGSTGTWTMNISDRVSGTSGSLTAAELQLFGASSSPVNQPPLITAASLSETNIGYSDTPLTVSSITATDPESNPISYLYQWQSSTDTITFNNETETSATLAPNSARAGKLWRCVITATDGNANSQPFTTAAVNLLTRPPASAAPGDPFSYASGLVLAPNSAAISRQAIINEFSQGPNNSTSEWIEILTLQSGSLRFWDLSSNGRILVFRNTSVWDNIPAGTLIVIWNGQTAKYPGIPNDDTNPADGLMVISSTNANYFDPAYDRWLDLANDGDYIELNDDDSNLIHSLSYGSNNQRSPHLSAVGNLQSAHFNSNTDAAADLVSAWTIIIQSSSTPGLANNTPNSSFITSIRNGSLTGPALFRLGAGVTLPAGLSLNPTTGVLSGPLSNNAVTGPYPITIERYNATPAVVSQSFSLNIAVTPTFANWITSFTPIANPDPTADPDADGLPNLVEYALDLNPKLAENPSPIIYQKGPTSISLTYRVSKLHADVTLTPEWSANLDGSQPWSSAGIINTVLEDNTDDQLRRAILIISPLDPKRFLRLRATLTP